MKSEEGIAIGVIILQDTEVEQYWQSMILGAGITWISLAECGFRPQSSAPIFSAFLLSSDGNKGPY